jgi:hypothetical protein
MRKALVMAMALAGAVAAARAQQPAAPAVPVAVPPPLPPLVAVKPIDPPATPLPSEAASAGVTRFSFIAYGDTRSGSDPGVPGDGQIIHPEHNLLADGMLAKAKELAATPFPLRFIVQSGDAVLRGVNGAMWNVSFTPIIEKLTHAGIPYFFAVGNHDVTGMPMGDRGRAQGVHNALTAMAKLIPPEGSPRRLSGYPTYTFGYGNTFVLAIDSNIASDSLQLAWIAGQLDHLDRARYEHIVAVFHHPIFSSGPHGGATLEPSSAAIRDLYAPLFRRHHVRMVIAGHDHLLDHWVERYDDGGRTYRRDDLVTGGGGAPSYVYSSEPDLAPYVAAGTAQKVRVEHLMRPGATTAENPHHFVVVRVDGSRLSLEVVALGGRPYAPYAGQSRIALSDEGS